jgi:hypothetical protein
MGDWGEAARAHARIPPELRRAIAPIVRRTAGPAFVPNLQHLAPSPPRAEIERADAWISIGQVVKGRLETLAHYRSRFSTPDPPIPGFDFGGHTRVGNHALLTKLLVAGRGFPNVISSFASRESVESDTATPMLWKNDQDVRASNDLARRLFTAGSDLVLRTGAQIFHLVNNFLVPITVRGVNFYYVLDQLWVAPPLGGNAARLISLVIDTRVHVPDRELERALAEKGYEVFHADGWWILIDPQRVAAEFFRTANIFVNRERRVRYPGPTIDHYRCASDICRRPFIRDELGYGIVEHKGLFVHEECFDRVVDEDEFGWFEGVTLER